MDQLIILFLHRDIEDQTSLSPILSILESIIEHPYRRNKTIHRNQATALQFILSGNTERTKRINRNAHDLELNIHCSVRYINTNECKGQSKNPYQVGVCPTYGGIRP